jgi:hypothetical protein
MPYENPDGDLNFKAGNFFRDFFTFDAFTRGSADYAYEAKGIAEAVGGMNTGFITSSEDRQLFQKIYAESVLREQALYNSAVISFNIDQKNIIRDEKDYLNELEIARRFAQDETIKVNKFQADAIAERLRDIEVAKKARADEIAFLTAEKNADDRNKVNLYMANRPPSGRNPDSLTAGTPETPLLPIIPAIIQPDLKNAQSLTYLLGLGVLGAFLLVPQ